MKKPSRSFPDETALWDFIAPNLRGKWWRLEAVTPDGLPDALGLWTGKTWWLELKVGKPDLYALRPAQRDFGYECVSYSVPHWTCFGYRGEARFFFNLDLTEEMTPPFYRVVA